MRTAVDGTRVTGFNEVVLVKGMKERRSQEEKGVGEQKKTAALMERRKTRRMY